MIRQIITIAAPLLAPFVIYYIWRWAARRRADAESQGKPLPHWQELPWTWLIISGAALTALVLVLTAVLGTETDGVYIPPHMEDGVIVPGTFER